MSNSEKIEEIKEFELKLNDIIYLKLKKLDSELNN